MAAKILYFADPRLAPLAVPIETLELDPDNESEHTEESVQEIVRSLVRFGWREPVGAVKSRRKIKTVIRGNRSLMAARWLAEAAVSDDPEVRSQAVGHESWWDSEDPPDWLMAPALFFPDDKATRVAWRVSHNQFTTKRQWNWPKLAENMADVSDEIDWSQYGWSDEELAELFDEPDGEDDDETGADQGGAGNEPDPEPPIPEVPAEPVTKRGEVIQLGDHVLHCEDCMVVMAGMADNSVDFIGTDGPYGLSPDGKARTWDEIEVLRAEGKGPKAGFMGRKWDAGVPGLKWARECLRILKPGGHLVSYSATRTYHRHACAVEDAGFEIRDMFGWEFYSGYPKSLDVQYSVMLQSGVCLSTETANHVVGLSKPIQVRSSEGKVVFALAPARIPHEDAPGLLMVTGAAAGSPAAMAMSPSVSGVSTFLSTVWSLVGASVEPLDRTNTFITATEFETIIGSKTWNYLVTASTSPSITHRKKTLQNGCRCPAYPVVESLSESLSKCGTIPTRFAPVIATSAELVRSLTGTGTSLKPAHEPAVVARKPLSEPTVVANVLKWGTGAINIDAGRFADGDPAWPGPSSPSGWETGGREPPKSGAVQFLKGVHLDPYVNIGRWPANIYATPKPATSEREAGVAEGAEGHPTVKPVKLMLQLLRLFCPPDGTAFEPFGGSGTTLVAACGLEVKVIACEMDPGYSDIIRARVEWALDQAKRKPGKPRVAPRDGDKRQARRRVQTLVENGSLDRPSDLTCVDCEDAPASEYDHHLGYGAAHHEDVEALCAKCHHAREAGREKAPA